MTYQLTVTDTLLRLADGAFIPADKSNSDYTIYLQWVEDGNTPLPNPDVKPYTWDQALSKRNAALTASDWTMTPGCTVDQHAWAVYRQILRDIPQTFAGRDPQDIIWPMEPGTHGPNTKPTEEAEQPVETPPNVVAEQEAAAAQAVVTVEEVAPTTVEDAAIASEPAAATIDTTEVK
jgi:hypothetical protein